MNVELLSGTAKRQIKKKQKREYQSSELVKAIAKKYGFEDKLLAFQVKDFLEEYLDKSMFQEIEQVDLKNKVISISIKSPLLKNDFHMRKSFFLKKIQGILGDHVVNDLSVLQA